KDGQIIMAIHRHHEFCPGDRYHYDFVICTTKNGFAQVDTGQDASYYGTWTNPHLYVIFSFVEGDCYTTQCDTADDYKEALLEVVGWNQERDYWKGIDPGYNVDLKQRFIDLGLGHLLH